MDKLVFDLDLYFERDPEAVEIELSLLAPSHISESSIQNAWEYMRCAAKGKIPKRKPIDVRRTPQRTFSILRGNSTFAVAQASGWPRILAVVSDPRID